MQARKVTLDEVECCAMTHAFLRHPAQVRAWSHVDGPLHVLYEIFHRTIGLSFVPNEQTVLVYRAFAVAEQRRLQGQKPRLLCRHGAAAHALALEQLLKQLPPHSSH